MKNSVKEHELFTNLPHKGNGLMKNCKNCIEYYLCYILGVRINKITNYYFTVRCTVHRYGVHYLLASAQLRHFHSSVNSIITPLQPFPLFPGEKGEGKREKIE